MKSATDFSLSPEAAKAFWTFIYRPAHMPLSDEQKAQVTTVEVLDHHIYRRVS